MVPRRSAAFPIPVKMLAGAGNLNTLVVRGNEGRGWAGVTPSERAAFETFVRAQGGELLRVACGLTGDRTHAEDLLQEALVRLAERWPRVGSAGNPTGWVCRVIANTRVSWWRRTRRETLVAAVPERGHVPVTPDVALLAALAGLPPRQRAVLALRYLADFSEQATAEALGCSTGTVKSQSAKALAKLREHLDSHRYEELR